MMWIYTTAHVPENKEPVLVLCKSNSSMWIVPDAYYNRGKWYELASAAWEEDLGEEYGFRWHPEEYREIKNDVIAWQYLPEVPDD